MVTKAIIVSTNSTSNKYTVRVPYLDNALTVNNPRLYEAILCYTPGITDTLKENDVVIVSFEDHQTEKIVIIGKLYLQGDFDNVGSANFESLSVSKKVTLPENTTLGGYDLFSVVSAIYNDVYNQHRMYKHTITGIGESTITIINNRAEAYISSNKATDLNEFYYAKSSSHPDNKILGFGYVTNNNLSTNSGIYYYYLSNHTTNPTIQYVSLLVQNLSDVVEEV